MDYMEAINHRNFYIANSYVHAAERLLVAAGMTLEEARGWIKAWASGAGDGIE